MNILPFSSSRVDFVLITALPEERDAVLAKLPAYHKLSPSNDDIRTYFQADLPITFPDSSTGKYRVVVMCLSGMGRVQAATATADAIRQWHPRYIMLIGIAGGIASRNVQIGDILISDQIVDYELQKLTSEGPEIRWEVQRAEPRLLNACINYQDESWQELINVERPRRGKPNRHVGPIASGDKVIAFGKILTKYQDVWLKLLGVEMEAAGAATAAFQASDRPGFFMVRGVSDLADENKGSSHVVKWRSYACHAAASFAIALLKSGPVPLLGETLQNKTKQVQLIFEGEFSEFTASRQQEIVSILATLLRIEQSDIRVLKVQRGSILMIIEMLGTAADEFYELVVAQDPSIITMGIKSILLEDGRHFAFANKSVEILNNQPEQIRGLDMEHIDPIHTYAVIMAGGGGTRLWPISRKETPKQLLPLLGKDTLFQSTVARLEKLFPHERILVVTVAEQAREMQKQVPAIPVDNYLIEPAPRGTASVVALAAAVLLKRDPQAAMAIQTSDHFIRNRDLFHYLISTAFDVAQKNYLVTLGITPTYPSTGYGYIQQGAPLEGDYKYPVYTVERFKEKPDQETAQKLLRSGDHSWNSGMFVWRADTIMMEIERQMPALYEVVNKIAEVWGTPQQNAAVQENWFGLKSQTIDYGVMEKAERVAVLPAGGLGWNDVGSWDSLFEVLLPDMNGNVATNAPHLALDTNNTLVYTKNDERLVVTIGLDDMVIVDAGDVLMVCKVDQSQKVKDVVEHLKKHHQEKYL